MFVFTNPILPGKTSDLIANLSQEEIHDCEIWVQTLCNKDYLVTRLNSDDSKNALSKMNYPKEMQSSYQKFCVQDLNNPESLPKMECIADYFYPNRQGEILYRCAFAYPLLPGMELKQKQFSQSCREGHLQKEFEEWSEIYQFRRHIKWIQKSSWGLFATCYQEFFTDPNKLEELLNNCPSWHLLVSNLEEQTGLKDKELDFELQSIIAHIPCYN